jgi:MtaA/CmuA family methyltransferase
MNIKKRIISGLLGGRTDRVPLWLPVVAVTVEMMEKSKTEWPQAHFEAEAMAKLAAMPWQLAELPAVTVPFCLSLEAEALGCEIDKGTLNRTPSVKKPAFKTPDEFAVPENLLETGRIPVVLRALEILSEKIGDEVPINAKVTGGFTIAGSIFGVNNFIPWIKTNPDYALEAVDYAGSVTKELIGAFEDHGADIISISDPTSSGDLLSGEQYREFVLPFHKTYANMAKKPSALHICGNTKELLPYIRHSGFDAYSFEEKVDVLEAKKILGDDISLIGNISPVGTMLQGNPEQIKVEVLQAIADGIDVLSSGCTLSPLTPLENIHSLVRTQTEYPVKKDDETIVREFLRGLLEGVRG